MKIGILTFFNAHNYGAVLQAYALKKYISGLGHETIIINYRNKYIEKAYPRKLKPRIRKKDYFNLKHFKKNVKELDIWYSSRRSWKIQYQKFELFINHFLLDNQKESWEQQISECDAIFFGSDQIWERNIIGPSDRIFIGDFNSTAIKISYAASCYSEASAIDTSLIRSLESFKKISVREQALAEKIENKLGTDRKVEVVIDPVFLLNNNSYDLMTTHIHRPQYRYVLFYMVSEDQELSRISKYLKYEYGKNIIEIHYYKNRHLKSDWQRADVGPEEFISLIKNADYVFTNSFHGTAFSLIYKKEFVVANKNMRITNLLHSLGLENRIISTLDEFKKRNLKPIDYTDVGFLMQELIRKSQNFIRHAIDEIK